ncbi:MAG: EAL domain-containing protein [Gammaproteobacteria bacterium]|nr:EAL domain-containing protein [Gammaproteobacteria bacterium]
MEAVGHSELQVDSSIRFQAARDAVFILDGNGRIVYANDAAERLYGYPLTDFPRLDLQALVASPETLKSLALTSLPGSGVLLSDRHRHRNGNAFPVDIVLLPLRGKTETLIFAIVRERAQDTSVGSHTSDLSESKRNEILLSGQKQILEMIASGMALPKTLTAIVQFIEEEATGMLGSILLLDDEGMHVRHGAAPSLPPEFINAVDGQPIGPQAGSCGTAAYTRQPVFVEDIATDPLWAVYKTVALPHGLRACWSTPVFDTKGNVLGTFAMYYREPGLPTPRHLKLIEMASHLAAIAIGRYRAEQALMTTQARLQKAQHVAGMGFWEWDLSSNRIYCSDEIYKLFGITCHEEYTATEFINHFVYPDDLAMVQEHLERAIKGGKECNVDHRVRRADGEIIWVDAQAELLTDPEQGTQVLLCTAQDISRRKLAEANVTRLSQLYAALSQCNQAIVRCANRDELFLQICIDAVKFGGMKMAWIGMSDDTGEIVTPVAWFGDGVEYLDGLQISLASDQPTSKGPTARAIRENQPFWCQHFQTDPVTTPWHERGKKYGWAASASLPLHCQNKVVGAISVYSDTEDAFDKDEQNLLIEMALDISFALDRFVSEDERRRVELALRESEQHLRTIVETEPECVKVINKEAEILEMNAAGLEILEADSLEQVKAHHLLEFITPPYRDEFLQLHRRVMSGETLSLEFEIEGLKGTRRWMGLHAAPMRDADGNITAVLGISRDFTDRKLSEERIQYMANFDTLTGLPNRIQMADHLQYAISLMKRTGDSLAVLFIDIDRFKDINDTLGHSIGDALLIQIAERIKAGIREEDTASRMGGDEFIVVLPECDAKGAALVAQKLIDLISAPYYVESYELVVTASIGIAIYPNDGDDLETLSRCADTAMYRAKTESRDTYRFFTAEMEVRAKRNMELMNALRYALELNQLEVVYQPQVSIHDGQIIGVEALLRWQHPDLGSVSPAEFIPVAEDSRLILSIGEWVIRTAVNQLKQWIDMDHPPIVMAVNLSAVQFRHASLSDLVTRILNDAGIPAGSLELELTEGVAMQDLKGGTLVMNNLHARGIRLSIDDFGTGYSSLSYLKKFKVYKLKIDKSFVQDITTDAEDKAIVAAIIGMAKKLGLQTIAEGVETEEQLAYLREQGCDEAQGYLFSRPLPPADIEKLLAK